MIKDVESIQIVDGIDELRGAVKDEIPPRERDPEKVYQHRPGQGRPPLPARSVLEGIFYVLRTGCQWKAVPIVHIRPRGEEKKELESDPHFLARRWVVEVLHPFLDRFHKLLVRFEKKAANYLALIHFACAVIVWRRLLPVHL